MKRTRAGLLPLLTLLVCSFAADGGGTPGGGGDPTPGGGGNPGGGTTGGGQQQPPQQPDPFTTAITGSGLTGGAVEGFRNLLARHNGDPLRAAAQLYDENHTLRTSRRDLTPEQMIEKLKEAGHRVLSKDEAAEHDAFVATGKKPAELTTIITEHGALSTEKQQREADTVIDKAAETHGYKPGGIFRSLVKANGLHVEAGTKKVLDQATNAEKDVPAYFVVTKDAQGKETARKGLDEYLRENFKDDEAALPRLDPNAGGAGGQQQQQTGGQQWVQQPAPSRQTGGANPAAAHITSTYGHNVQKPAA